MAGTASATHGGISSVVNAWRAAGLFSRWPVDYVETHCDGSRLAKLAKAMGAFFEMLSLMARHRCALLHVHSASRASFWRKAVMMSLARIAGWPYVFHLHGGGFARFHDRECGALRRALVRHFLDGAAAIVVVSERWIPWMRTATANPRIVCIPNPVSMPAAIGAARAGSLVAFVGRCSESKGAFDLLEAVNEVRGTFPEVRLECAGDGDLDALQQRASELGMRAHLHVPGWIGRRRRDELLARAAVFVLPSHAEGVPVSLLEAMAAGCAVVATRVGGIPDVVADGVNGLLVDAGDREALALAIHRLLIDRALAARLGREARDTVARRHAPEISLERLERLYAGLGVQRDAAHAPARAPRLQEIS
jgi:glycosyltransferase involved in cell wall biosynthesis